VACLVKLVQQRESKLCISGTMPPARILANGEMARLDLSGGERCSESSRSMVSSIPPI
jgi:hypothetical protein